MNEKALILERSIQNDLQAIADIFARLEQVTLSDDEETLIVIAYRLHSLYMAFENIFQQIATTFENNLGEKSGWHSQLLQRMKLDLTPIRPAVIDDTTYVALDELRRFRHLFRTNYNIDFDRERLQLVLKRAWQLHPLYEAQIGQFLNFLKSLQ
ncbi:MAG: hypothetical protein H6658_03890 [Ardenticatenaceae bacterium]|nr:hypothetical protein [Ardenticatenaceae bacterium]